MTMPENQTCEKCGQPVPAQAEAGGITLEALDEQIALLDAFPRTQAMARALRPLVEEAKCKRRIVEAGCGWSHHPFALDEPMPIAAALLSDRRVRCNRATWPEAAAWAEAQAAKRELRWFQFPMRELTDAEKDELGRALGYTSGIGCRNREVLLGIAIGRGLWDQANQRIKFPPEEATP